jgi:hypothetical protein
MELTKRANQDAETAQIKHLTCWGIRKSDGAPEHKRWKTKEQTHERSSEVGDKESPSRKILQSFHYPKTVNKFMNNLFREHFGPRF